MTAVGVMKAGGTLIWGVMFRFAQDKPVPNLLVGGRLMPDDCVDVYETIADLMCIVVPEDILKTPFDRLQPIDASLKVFIDTAQRLDQRNRTLIHI